MAKPMAKDMIGVFLTVLISVTVVHTSPPKYCSGRLLYKPERHGHSLDLHVESHANNCPDEPGPADVVCEFRRNLDFLLELHDVKFTCHRESNCISATSCYFELSANGSLHHHCCVTRTHYTPIIPQLHLEAVADKFVRQSPYIRFVLFVTVNLIAMTVFTPQAVNAIRSIFERRSRLSSIVRHRIRERTDMTSVLQAVRAAEMDPLTLVMSRKFQVFDRLSEPIEASPILCSENRIHRESRSMLHTSLRSRMIIKLNVLRKNEIEMYKEFEQERLRLLQFVDKQPTEDKPPTVSNKSARK